MPGPPPKRTAQRRRANKPPVPIDAAPGQEVERPRPNAGWHPIAKRWFVSLGESGQAVFYQASDWAVAYLIAESISRELKPQVIGTAEDGTPIKAALPPKGASLTAWLRAMTVLMATEGDRRRLRLELYRAPASEEAEPDVSELAAYRRRLQSS